MARKDGLKFTGTYRDLQDAVLLTGVFGHWEDLGTQKRYVATDGAILNWWETSKTVNFQGKGAEVFKEAFLRVGYDAEGRSAAVKDVREAAGEDAAFRDEVRASVARLEGVETACGALSAWMDESPRRAAVDVFDEGPLRSLAMKIDAFTK